MEQKEQTAFGRRDFLKTTAVIGAFGALSSTWSDGLVPRANAAPINYDRTGTKIVKTNCRSCTADCGVLAHVKDGRVIKLEGNPEFGRSEGALCSKGLAGIQALYHPNRNKYPLERVGARGENKWKRISWEEAIDKISKKLMEIREKYGEEQVLASTGGGGNPNFYSACRFSTAFNTPNWFEPGAAQCYMPRTLMYAMTYGGGKMGNTSLADSNCMEAYFYKDTKMKSYVLWGTAPSYSGPSQHGRVMVELRAKGVKTVVIDPRFTPDAAKADIWLPIRPGTDVALALSWIRYIIKQDLYDKEFTMKWTNMPYLVNTQTKMLLRESDIISGGREKVYVVWDKNTNSAKPIEYPWDDALSPVLDGEFTVNGVLCKTGFTLLKERVEPWTLEKAAEICCLNVNKIEEAINLYAKNTPSSVTLGVATDQNANSTQAAHSTAIMDILMGNIEKPGVVLQRFEEGHTYASTKTRSSMVKHMLSPSQLKKRLGGNEFKGMLNWWIANPPAVLDAMETGKPYKLRAWIERSGNKMAMVANPTRWANAIKNMELVVHMFVYPTSFSAYSDFILPTTEWLETDYFTDSFNMVFARQAVTHLYETVNETFIWGNIVKRCAELGHENCKRAMDPKATAPESPWFGSYEEQLDYWGKNAFGLTWAEVKQKIPFEAVPFEKWRRYFVYKETDPKTGKPKGFNTPSKKCEVYLDSLITLGRTGKPWIPSDDYILEPASHDYNPLPFYIEPDENPNNEIGKTYPLVMTNGRLPVYHHGTLRNIPYIREIFPVAEIWVNPIAAKKYGVAQGDWVNVESLRGKIKAKARVTEGIPPNTVYMERFWNPETLNTPTHGWQEMNVNVLSKESGTLNEVIGTYTLRGFQVRISKATDGAPKGIWEKPEEFKPWMPDPSAPTKTVTL